jgi:hypothetical protein
MATPSFTLMVALLLLTVSSHAGSRNNGTQTIKTDYQILRITDKVYVIYGPSDRPNPKNQGFRNNPASVIPSAGVIVIDPGSSLYTGEMVLKKIRTITQAAIVTVLRPARGCTPFR